MVDRVELRIREASEHDLHALEWEGEYIHFRRVYKEAMKEARRGRRVIFVAECGDDLVGQIFVNLHSTWRNAIRGSVTGYLHSFRVKPAFRNQGIGQRLIETAEACLIEHGFRRAVISVSKTNKRALRLYQNLGYEILGEDPGRWSFLDHRNKLRHVSEPAYILQKPL
jgi:ribosomal protein S18 acetylase RimI-like enzyme